MSPETNSNAPPSRNLFKQFNDWVDGQKKTSVAVAIGFLFTVAWGTFEKVKAVHPFYEKWQHSQSHICGIEREKWSTWRALPRAEIAQRFAAMRTALEAEGDSNDWGPNIRRLTQLVKERSVMPGLQENLGAMYLEMGDFGKAKTQLENELTTLSCLERDPGATKELVLVDPAADSDPSNAARVIRRAHGIADYNLAEVYAQQGDPNEAFKDLRLAITYGFPADQHELDELERDRFLKPLRQLPEYELLMHPLRIAMGH